MNKPPIEAAIFDLGGVILEVGVVRTVHAWADASGLDPSELTARLGGRILPRRFDRGEVKLEDLRAEVCARLGREISSADFEAGWNALLGLPFPGADDLLERLSRRMRLVMLTNTNETHEKVWRQSCAGVLPYFEKVFSSWRMGVRKPDPEAFGRVLDYLALPPERVAFFDDHQENVDAATQLGMVAHLVNGPANVERCLE